MTTPRGPQVRGGRGVRGAVPIVGSVGDVCLFTSLPLDSSDKVHISYLDNTNGDLKYAAEVSVVSVPSAPRNLQATAGDEYVRLSWNEPSPLGSGTLTYHLFRNGAEIWSGGALAYNDTVVVNGATYTYNVACHNDAGWGPNSTIS